jgi:hypothetical protein
MKPNSWNAPIGARCQNRRTILISGLAGVCDVALPGLLPATARAESAALTLRATRRTIDVGGRFATIAASAVSHCHPTVFRSPCGTVAHFP